MFSSALSRCFCGVIYSMVRILCKRSASLIIITLISSDMAMSIFRIFSACCSSREEKGTLPSLVTPLIKLAISLPNIFVISSKVMSVSSTTSCSKPATTQGVSMPSCEDTKKLIEADGGEFAVSMPSSTKIQAAATGCVMYGSPDFLFCSLCASAAT